MITTPGEARVRADVLLLVGDGLDEAWPALERPAAVAPCSSAAGSMFRDRIVRLASGARDATLARPVGPYRHGRLGRRSRLRGQSRGACGRASRAVGRSSRRTGAPRSTRSPTSERRRRFGVAIWSASSARRARDRDAQRPRARSQRVDPVLLAPPGRARQRRRRSRGLRVDDGLSHAHRIRLRRRRRTTPGGSTPSGSLRCAGVRLRRLDLRLRRAAAATGPAARSPSLCATARRDLAQKPRVLIEVGASRRRSRRCPPFPERRNAHRRDASCVVRRRSAERRRGARAHRREASGRGRRAC